MEVENKWDGKIIELAYKIFLMKQVGMDYDHIKEEYDKLVNKHNEAKEQGPWKD